MIVIKLKKEKSGFSSYKGEADLASSWDSTYYITLTY